MIDSSHEGLTAWLLLKVEGGHEVELKAVAGITTPAAGDKK